MTHELLSLPYSPWSIAASWALRHAGVEVRHVEYKPMVGEPLLRWRLRTRRPVTVPVLFVAGDTPRTSMLDIARWAHAQSPESALFPPAHRAEVERWVALALEMMAAGRARVSSSIVDDPRALGESVPKAIMPIAALRPWVGRFGALFLRKKYRFDALDADATLDRGVASLREAIASSGRVGAPLVGTFSFADIAMASAMQFVAPLPNDQIRLGATARGHWHDEARASEEMIAWRDAIVAGHW